MTSVRSEVDGAPGGGRGSRRRRRWLTASLLVGLIGLSALLLVVANPRFPAIPELEGIPIEPPPSQPLSPALAKLLTPPESPPAVPQDPELTAALEALEQGRWPHDPVGVRAALAGADSPLERFERAFFAPGCLPALSVEQDGPAVSYQPLRIGARLFVLRAVLAGQDGQLAEAGEQLSRLQRRATAIEQGCQPPLLPMMVLLELLDFVHRSWGYLLLAAGFEQAVGDARWRELWRELVQLERRENPMPDVFRREYAWLRAALIAELDRAPAEEVDLRVWPWFDRADTLRIHDTLTRRAVWLAEQPLDPVRWRAPRGEVVFFETLRRRPAWLNLFRYNSVGRTLTAIAAPADGRWIAAWHTRRCTLAARRASWLETLRARRLPAPAEARTPAPRDPFTGRPFSPAALTGKLCEAPGYLSESLPLAEPLAPVPDGLPPRGESDRPVGPDENAPARPR